MIANETLIGTLMKTEILTNNYTINYTNIIRTLYGKLVFKFQHLAYTTISKK